MFIVPVIRDCYDVMKHQQTAIAMQKEQIHKLLMERKEDAVNALSLPIARMMSM